eukprot:5132871-Prymnesium_polylepis.1
MAPGFAGRRPGSTCSSGAAYHSGASVNCTTCPSPSVPPPPALPPAPRGAAFAPSNAAVYVRDQHLLQLLQLVHHQLGRRL